MNLPGNSSLDNGLKLWRAVKTGQLPRVKYLLKSGADFTYRCEEDGTTPLHQAALVGDIDILQVLLQAGASVDDEDREGATALHYAAKRRIVAALIVAGADVDHEDHAGKTPGRRAHERSDRIVVCELLYNHADPSKIYFTIGDGDDGGLVMQDSQNIEQAALERQNELEQSHTRTAATLITPSTTEDPSETNLGNASPERRLLIGIVSTIHSHVVGKVTNRSLARRSRRARRRQLTP